MYSENPVSGDSKDSIDKIRNDKTKESYHEYRQEKVNEDSESMLSDAEPAEQNNTQPSTDPSEFIRENKKRKKSEPVSRLELVEEFIEKHPMLRSARIMKVREFYQYEKELIASSEELTEELADRLVLKRDALIKDDIGPFIVGIAWDWTYKVDKFARQLEWAKKYHGDVDIKIFEGLEKNSQVHYAFLQLFIVEKDRKFKIEYPAKFKELKKTFSMQKWEKNCQILQDGNVAMVSNDKFVMDADMSSVVKEMHTLWLMILYDYQFEAYQDGESKSWLEKLQNAERDLITNSLFDYAKYRNKLNSKLKALDASQTENKVLIQALESMIVNNATSLRRLRLKADRQKPANICVDKIRDDVRFDVEHIQEDSERYQNILESLERIKNPDKYREYSDVCRFIDELNTSDLLDEIAVVRYFNTQPEIRDTEDYLFKKIAKAKQKIEAEKINLKKDINPAQIDLALTILLVFVQIGDESVKEIEARGDLLLKILAQSTDDFVY